MNPTAAPPRTPRSLQARLLLAVLTLVLLAWASAAALTWHEAEDEVGDLLDAHLAQTAALLRLQPLEQLDEEQLNEAPQLDKHQTRVVFQLWNEDQLLTRSKNAPDAPLTDRQKMVLPTAAWTAQPGACLWPLGASAVPACWSANGSRPGRALCWPASPACSNRWPGYCLCWRWASGGWCASRCGRCASSEAMSPRASRSRWCRWPQPVCRRGAAAGVGAQQPV